MCVTPAYRRASPEPAGQQAISSVSNPFSAGPPGDLVERPVAEGNGQEAELHRADFS